MHRPIIWHKLIMLQIFLYLLGYSADFQTKKFLFGHLKCIKITVPSNLFEGLKINFFKKYKNG